MKIRRIRQALSIPLLLSMILSLVSPAFALCSTKESCGETHIQEIVNGDLFIQWTDTRLVAIATNDIDHLIDISIKYIAEPDSVYHKNIYDYPIATFCPNELSFWFDIIEYAETKLDKTPLPEILIEDIKGNDPMVASSAGSDLAKDLEGLVGAQYSDRYIPPLKTVENHIYRLYETMEYHITTVKQLTWKTFFDVSTFVVSVLGLMATAQTMSIACGVLGLIFTGAGTAVPPGKMNKYNCMVMYTRYVTIDGGSRHYGPAYKFRSFDGYEDADLNSTGRASVVPNDDPPYYGTTEEFFNSGIFVEAYNAYNNIF